SIVAALSKQGQRDGAAQRGRQPLAAERASLQKTFATEFPDYSALSNPLPLKTKEIQSLLAGDEARVVFALADKESYGGASSTTQASHASGKSQLFDLARANGLYVALFGQVEALVKDKRSLLVAPSGALTALPFHLLVTETPAAAIPDKVEGYRDAARL